MSRTVRSRRQSRSQAPSCELLQLCAGLHAMQRRMQRQACSTGQQDSSAAVWQACACGCSRERGTWHHDGAQSASLMRLEPFQVSTSMLQQRIVNDMLCADSDSCWPYGRSACRPSKARVTMSHWEPETLSELIHGSACGRPQWVSASLSEESAVHEQLQHHQQVMSQLSTLKSGTCLQHPC